MFKGTKVKHLKPNVSKISMQWSFQYRLLIMHLGEKKVIFKTHHGCLFE
jgi:hypothetical protein